ncbi:Hypothetical protein Tcol_1598 [Trichococcus collinsii]|uniref:protein adenylyltransferase n=1 Tax=Trichococcus collinsii TaxID=157076 RepID=A0AB38A2R5_9LACT|nr:Hypothetical protein Tcol_1598 [Trichococcus collinsii]SEA81342.1 cell filamentation protein [Trichococcus collinsii]
MLDNKLGITNQVEFVKMEERISKTYAKRLYDSGGIKNLEFGTYKGLAAVHKYVFYDIYDFAGKTRILNISKENFRFAPSMHLEVSLDHIGSMPQSTIEEIVAKYVEMNIAHPFRDGNGRSARIWLDLILKKELRKVVDWNQINKDDYLSAMERSPVNDLEIRFLISNALNSSIDDL